jgi:hypothetical protein
MYFEDLSAYSYYLNSPLRNVFNVGWLDASHAFPTGTVPSSTLTRLRALISDAHATVDVHVNRIRGIHPCNLCGRDILFADNQGRARYLGMSEVWLPGDQVWYAAPSLALHYIEEHRYVPPCEYVAAIERFDISEAFHAQSIYLRLVNA